MRDFITHVLSSRENYTNIYISYTDIKKIEKAVMTTLNLTNLKDLRDKFEGLKFYDSFTLKSFGVIALGNLLKIDLVNWDEIEPRNYEAIVSIEGKLIDVINFEYGEFPVIDKKSSKPAIFACKRDKQNIWICGYASIEILDNNQDDKYIKGVMTRNIESKTTFTGFNKLKYFSNIEELKELIVEN
ncbi:hypothetical protein [Maribacter thermophilus]|uniref:hypothetical protein n=1 Tax=Maribacter thermophilus TaxID=1197874 RepID=UPI0006414F14|nr:hypothetical protein [Maribacter thermophilus]